MLEKKTYQQPEIKVVKMNDADIICTSFTNGQNEEFKDGSTYGWY